MAKTHIVPIAAGRPTSYGLGQQYPEWVAFPQYPIHPPHMIQTVEAIVDERGAVRLLEPLQLDRSHRALVTILADEPSDAHETALLSEAALTEDWNRPEEDAAWSHLQQAP